MYSNLMQKSGYLTVSCHSETQTVDEYWALEEATLVIEQVTFHDQSLKFFLFEEMPSV